MVEEVKLNKEKLFEDNIKRELNAQGFKYINMYYRAEGTFIFSFITLMLVLFHWDTIQQSLFYFVFTLIFNILLMGYFLFKHFKQVGIFN